MDPSFCHEACHSGNYMADSCKKHCPGYNLPTTSPLTTTGTTLGAFFQPESNSLALRVIIPSVTAISVAMVILVLWCCRKKIIKLIHAIKLQFEKLPTQETGNGHTSVCTVSVVHAVPQRTLAEVRVISEVHHSCEAEALLGDRPTAGLKDSKPGTSVV